MGKDRPGLGALGLAVTRPQSRSVTTHTYRDGRQSQPTKMAFTILSTTRSEDERKRAETEVQKMTDETIKEIDTASAAKEKEILGK